MILVVQIEGRVTRLIVFEIHDDGALRESVAVKDDPALHKVKQNTDSVSSVVRIEVIADLFASVPQSP